MSETSQRERLANGLVHEMNLVIDDGGRFVRPTLSIEQGEAIVAALRAPLDREAHRKLQEFELAHDFLDGTGHIGKDRSRRLDSRIEDLYDHFALAGQAAPRCDCAPHPDRLRPEDHLPGCPAGQAAPRDPLREAFPPEEDDAEQMKRRAAPRGTEEAYPCPRHGYTNCPCGGSAPLDSAPPVPGEEVERGEWDNREEQDATCPNCGTTTCVCEGVERG